MLVAVVTKTLALNKGEKHVHFFMLDIQISKRVRKQPFRQQRFQACVHRLLLRECARPCVIAFGFDPASRVLSVGVVVSPRAYVRFELPHQSPPRVSERLYTAAAVMTYPCLSPRECWDRVQQPKQPWSGMNGG